MSRLSRVGQYLSEKVGNIKNSTLRQNLLQALPFWVASAITGIVAVLYARVFAMAEEASGHLVEQRPWIVFIITPVFFYLAWWVCQKFSPAARGSGIPQVMAAIELANPRSSKKIDWLLGLRVMIVKICSSMLMVLGGGAIGREGPTIQIAGSIFRLVNKLLPASWPKVSKRNMIMTGAAAGLAAAFNTPLGGIVFAVEELTKTHFRYFRTAIFSAVIIAGLTAQGLLGPYLYLGYPDMHSLSWYIILIVMIVAVIAGLGGSTMAKLILKVLVYKRNFTVKKNLLFLFGMAMIMACFSYFFSTLAVGSGKEIMTITLFTPYKNVDWYLPLVRYVGTIASFATGGAGGVFAPGLAAGATVGSVMAHWFHMGGSNANILILAGMVGFLTGITRSPFTSAILVLEMTDRHNVIFHLMVAGMIANVVSLAVDKHSLYDKLKEGYIEEANHSDEPIPASLPVPKDA